MKGTMIGVDLAKNVFVLYAATMAVEVRYLKKVPRGQFLRFLSEQPPAIVIM